ncbi:MAG TPA: TRZ/ATZ family hydrolase [Rhodocyclaceae bacterium]|nr:TRZ/ATZ family hydrolase [Rhodocyclaceae bacterium]
MTTHTAAPESADIVIEARWIIPIEPTGIALNDHAVVIRDGCIIDLLSISRARMRYVAKERIELPDHVLLPGLVNLHTHSPMSLMRGIADDLPLMRWLNEAIWPIEQKYVSDEFVYEGTLLGGAEMLQGGITCANDMYFYPDASARAFDELGMRAVIGMAIIDFPTSYAADPDDYLRKGLAVRDAWREHPRLGFSFAPHSPYAVSDTSFERVVSFANELDAPLHLHLHETAAEVDDSLRTHGVRPLARLERLGLLGPNLTVAHAVHMTDDEIALLAACNVSVAHNPTSNMKLASGIAPIKKMIDASVVVGLGTDGAASNNRLDIFQEMRHASLLAKVATGDASALPAHRVLKMATLDGARALGLAARIGSIEIGKRADLCAVSLADTRCQPCFDPASHLVYVAGREHVSDVWVDGIRRVERGVLLHPHHTTVRHISSKWANILDARKKEDKNQLRSY